MVRSWFVKGRLHGMRQVVDTIIFNVSHYYDLPGEPPHAPALNAGAQYLSELRFDEVTNWEQRGYFSLL